MLEISLRQHVPDMSQQLAATAIFLATKVEENCRKMKELVVACCRVAQKNPNLMVDEQTKDFWKWRDTILYNEDVLLETICFDLTVESPHKLFFDMIRYYGIEHNKRLRTAGWAFVSDSNVTQLCLLATSRTIAASALYCAARLCQLQLPDEDGKPWWEIQHVQLAEMKRACNYMVDLYEHVQPKDGGESIYVGLRTPPDDDSAFASTRLRSEQTPQSPIAAALAMERNGSDQGVKRARAESTSNGPSTTNGEPAKVNDDDARELKRPRMEENGVSDFAPTKPENGLAPEGEDVSEEGELEE